MGRGVRQLTLFGVLVALAAAQPKKDDWDIESFEIGTTVISRYAITDITSHVTNRMNESKEIEFHVQIPKNAFISGFRMRIDDKWYKGVVKTKEQAQQQDTEAVLRGQSAGIVSSVGRTMEDFKTSVTVQAKKRVEFELTYEELLKRSHGKYELQIHARPMQPVTDFRVEVYIKEKAGISYIDVKGGLRTKALANAISTTHVNTQAWVYFYPTVDQQQNCDSCGEQGINGDLVIVYDVNQDNGLGDIKTSDGYFVHHFAPSSLPRIPKNVVFIIDQSGSMHGRKIEQTRTALIYILSDLAEDDFFGLITFDSDVIHWKRELVKATRANLEGAKVFARNISDRGATDINAAVLEGARMLNAHPREGSASILILLTDGDPTSGVTNPEAVQSNVKQAIAGKFPLYCLGFGFDVNFEFLERMSLGNSGKARRIYEDSDADLQLKGFYEEVATPLLTDITMIYVGGTNVTQTNFSQYYNGSELVVAGEIIDNNIKTFMPQVVAISGEGQLTFSKTINTVDSSIEFTDTIQRLWAYLTVKQRLEQELLVSGPEKEKVRSEAVELSLKYRFVTPLTSMVVTKPPGENMDILHKPKEGVGAQVSMDVGLSSHAAPPDFPGVYDSDFVNASSVLNASSTAAPVSHRFLLQSKNQAPPLCFDVSRAGTFKLLHHPSKELYINGELDLITNGGFQKIIIKVGADQHVEVDAEGVSLRQGQSTTRHTGQDLITAGRLAAIRRVNEVDVTLEDVHLVILVHEKDGNKFLWPVLRQKPSAENIEGLVALKPADYQMVRQQSDAKLKLKDRESSFSDSTAADYSIANPVSIGCRLVSADFALEKSLDDYFEV